MIPELVKQWEENKHKLEEYFKTTRQEEYKCYEPIVKKLFELCFPQFNADKMTVIDDGGFQGTRIFIIPIRTYAPSVDEYVITDSYYGSEDDTLFSIRGFDEEGLPTYA